jgi:serine phosphatase RsbU (regulator of sigma subunit)
LRAAEGLVAGDCYDVSLLSPTEIGVVVLDIGGHGAIAAVSAFRCNELLKVALRNDLDPGDALAWLYEQEHGLNDLFFTAFVASIDTETGMCRYANAGHPPAMVSVGGGDAQPLGPTGPLVFSDIPPGWGTRRVTLPPGTLLGIYTDGLTEARNGDREFFGEERLFDLFTRAPRTAAESVVSFVLAELTTFHPGRLHDDATLVVLARAS